MYIEMENVIKKKKKKTGKRNHLVHFSCQFVVKYLMCDMMNYHCLKVFGTRVRRIGKQSPVFSVFRTRVHGCSDAELVRVPCCDPEHRRGDFSSWQLV